MPSITIKKATDSELIRELENRGLLINAWSYEDMQGAWEAVVEHADFVGVGLGGVEQDVIEAHAKRTFNAIKDDLEEALCACGNEMLADAWSREREVIKGNRRAARKAAKLATAA